MLHVESTDSEKDNAMTDLDTLTEFEQAVLRKTMEIPYGEVRPYSWVAREIGRPRAVRAVGSALAGPRELIEMAHRKRLSNLTICKRSH